MIDPREQADEPSHGGPQHSIAKCPLCGGGLCGIRVCTGDDPTEERPPGGFVMCDECEAVWLEPDVKREHLYVDPENPRCPICRGGLWAASRWADSRDVEGLGWVDAVDRDLDWR